MVRFPATGRELSAGVEMDAAPFEQLADICSRIECPFCGLDHDWSTREAWLENPPPSAPGASLVVHQQPKCGKRLMYIRQRNPLGSYPCATLSDCFGDTYLFRTDYRACSSSLDRGIVDWFRNFRLPRQCRSIAVPRTLYQELRKELCGVIGVRDRESQVQDQRSGDQHGW